MKKTAKKRFTLCIALAALLGLTFVLPASSQALKWERNYGGAGSEYGYSVQQTTDGGYIVAGDHSLQNYNFYLVKTNASGDTLWTRSYGGSWYEECYFVRQTTDGGYIVAGMTMSFGNGDQVYLVKTNASGILTWQRNYGGTATECGYSVQQTSDGGYIIVGGTESFGNDIQVYLIKTNASGDTLWTRTYGGPGWDEGYSVRQTSDGGYIVAGRTEDLVNYYQVYLLKTDASGDTLWSRAYGGTDYDRGESVQQTSDGGYIVAGRTDSFGDSYQVYLLKTDAFGDTLWTKTYGGAGWDWGYSVQQTTDGGYIITGYTDSFGNGDQVYLIKTNAQGDTLWTRLYGGADRDWGQSVQQTTDGGYIVAGWTESFGNNSQVYLIKTDANGSSGVEETAGVRDQGLGVRVTAKPNPFVTFATVPEHTAERFNLYDVAGRRVGTYRGDRIGEGLAPGVYFLRSSDSKNKPLRIVKVR
jgi:hypothetical protein